MQLIEILLLKRRENDIWETLVKPGKKCKVGTVISFGDGILTGEVVDIVDEGNRLIQFHYDGIFEEILDQLGEMPLPPYITHKLKDKNRYQTVYAKHDGSRSRTDRRTALYKRASAAGTGCGCKDRPCDPACRPWHLPSGEGGGCRPSIICTLSSMW